MTLLLLALLQSPPVAAKVPTRIPEDPVRGRELWEAHCWQCHGPDGEGDGPLSAALPTLVDPLPTLEGLPWGPLLGVVRDGHGDMPAYGHVISDTDTERILIWINDQQRGAGKVKPRRKTPKLPLEPDPDPGDGPADGARNGAEDTATGGPDAPDDAGE